MGLMSGIRKAGRKIKKAAKKIGKKAKQAADKIEEAASAAGNAVGNLIEEGANALPSGWFGNIVSGVGSVIGTAVRAIFDVTGGVIGGVIKIVAGSITLNGSLFVEGIGGIVASVVGAALLGILDVVSLIQRPFFGEKFSRPLTNREAALLRRIFHEALDYDVIRLVIGRSGVLGLFGLLDRPFTKGNTIYMKDRYPTDRVEDEDEALLVHEVTHVWQFQNRGVRYISEAFYAQVFIEDEYDWDQGIEYSNKTWGELNREAQSEFFEDLYMYGRLMDRTIPLPGDNVPNRYNFAGAFFVDTEKQPNLEPVFPWHTTVVDPPYPANGHIFEAIRRYTEFAIEATEVVRDG